MNSNLIRVFSGTYENMWDVQEWNDEGDELAIDYKFDDLMKSIVSVYKDNEKHILTEMNIPFINSIKLKKTYFTPREYNFKTDELDFNISVNKIKLLKALDKLKDNKKFDKHLHDNYSSYDGFMSFTPNNYKELREQITTRGDEFEQSMGALITYLVGRERLRSIEFDVYEEWSCNGYGGLEYKLMCDACNREVSCYHKC